MCVNVESRARLHEQGHMTNNTRPHKSNTTRAIPQEQYHNNHTTRARSQEQYHKSNTTRARSQEHNNTRAHVQKIKQIEHMTTRARTHETKNTRNQEHRNKTVRLNSKSNTTRAKYHSRVVVYTLTGRERNIIPHGCLSC